jgi:transketolase
LALDNLYYLVDWNDFGIDDHPISTIVDGTPDEWFASHGWRVFGANLGNDWGPVTQAILEMVMQTNPQRVPSVTWIKTRKGRGYYKYDNKSHGSPHNLNDEDFWRTKADFAAKYGVNWEGFGEPAPSDPKGLRAQFAANLKVVAETLRSDQALVDYLADTLVDLGDSVPEEMSSLRIGHKGNPFKDQRLYDFRNYPQELYVPSGSSAANRNALAKWGAWVNAFGHKEYDRPIFLACSADLADSTNISGFGKPWDDFEGYGWYERRGGPEGAMLPQGITEFINAGLIIGAATTNLATDLEAEFDGFYGAASTYGSFSYLKYGLMRLFSQLAQDCDFKVGKVLWVAGHSGPETADDSRTHFGIFAPGVTQLFPEGQVINVYPWEHNEVPVVLGAALATDVPIIALHLTRPSIEIPDREALGMASHFEASKGAYLVRDYAPGKPRGGTLIVQGTSAMASIVKILPQLKERDLNVKIVAAISPQLFAMQSPEYRDAILPVRDQVDSTVITTQARWLMHDWLFNKVAEEYALSSDWDNRWRTGGTLDEVIAEARLSPDWVLQEIERFVRDREERLDRLHAGLEAARQ